MRTLTRLIAPAALAGVLALAASAPLLALEAPPDRGRRATGRPGGGGGSRRGAAAHLGVRGGGALLRARSGVLYLLKRELGGFELKPGAWTAPDQRDRQPDARRLKSPTTRSPRTTATATEASRGLPAPVTRLLLATNNPGKVREMRRLLAGEPFEVVTPADLGISLDPGRGRRRVRGERDAQGTGLRGGGAVPRAGRRLRHRGGRAGWRPGPALGPLRWTGAGRRGTHPAHAA